MPDRIEQMQDVARALAGTANQMLIAATAGDTERVCDLRNKLIAELTSGASNAVRSRTCHVNSCTTFGRFLRTPRLATTRAAAS